MSAGYARPPWKGANLMNDCLWFWIGICDCPGHCNKYLSVNSEKGNEIREKYDLDVEEALKPVREKYRAIAGLEGGVSGEK